MDQQDIEDEPKRKQADLKTYTRPQVRTDLPIDKAVLYASSGCGKLTDESGGCNFAS